MVTGIEHQINLKGYSAFSPESLTNFISGPDGHRSNRDNAENAPHCKVAA